MHVDTGWSSEKTSEASATDTELTRMGDYLKSFRSDDIRKLAELTYEERTKAYNATIQELDSIFERTYGPVKPRYDAKADEERKRKAANKAPEKPFKAARQFSPEDSYLLVEGYNIIYANDELRSLAENDMKSARDKLMDILSNFQGYRRETVILVFDAYRVPGGTEHVLKYHNLDVVFTKEAETADQYIERTAHEYSKKSSYHCIFAVLSIYRNVILNHARKIIPLRACLRMTIYPRFCTHRRMTIYPPFFIYRRMTYSQKLPTYEIKGSHTV
jgi:hypothetical protein